MSDARTVVFERIRASLAAARAEGPAPVAPDRDGPVPGTPGDLGTPAARTAGFVERLEFVKGHVHRVAAEGEVAAVLARLAEARGARTIAVSDDPRARDAAAATGATLLEPGCPREELLAADLGATGAQAGIAETGTLLLDHAAERHRLASLVPPIHVAVLDAAAIVGTLGDALASLGGRDALARRAVTFVTGPSRTADIELTLVVGVHGPRELHVILIDPPHTT